MIEFRVTQEGPTSGEDLMTMDFELLQKADRGEMGACLRFYEWACPTISLGFHQSPEVLNTEELTRNEMPWVKRPTGGAAVLHSEELTYAVVLPLNPEMVSPSIVQEFVSRAIAAGLREYGVPAEVDARGEPLSALPNRVSCFTRTSRWEVTVQGKKLVGSAQRKMPNAILQHGSILTGNDHLRIVDFLRVSSDSAREQLRNRLSGHSTSISEVHGQKVNLPKLRQALEASFRATFRNWSPVLRTVGKDS